MKKIRWKRYAMHCIPLYVPKMFYVFYFTRRLREKMRATSDSLFITNLAHFFVVAWEVNIFSVALKYLFQVEIFFTWKQLKNHRESRSLDVFISAIVLETSRGGDYGIGHAVKIRIRIVPNVQEIWRKRSHWRKKYKHFHVRIWIHRSSHCTVWKLHNFTATIVSQKFRQINVLLYWRTLL